MIYPGQIYKVTSDHVAFLPKGHFFQVMELKSDRQVEIIHYDNTHVGSFEGSKKSLMKDQIFLYSEKVFDFKSLL